MFFVRLLQMMFLIVSSVMAGAIWGGKPLSKELIFAIGIATFVGILLLEIGILAGKAKQKSEDYVISNKTNEDDDD